VTALRLTHLSLDRVEFVLVDDDGCSRPVVARVGSATDWRAAVRFPTVGSDATETTGDDDLDHEIRERAAEWLVVLEAAVQAAREGRWIA
jgi:hypothetical protein